jgi:pSer/pThr/pTyr-binding forkhead associated (FHA) protein
MSGDFTEMHKLICLSGMNKGGEFALAEGENSIGRSEKNNICVFDKKVSRTHCRLHVSEKSVLLEDFGSTNGSRINNVFVNGKQEIKAGDHLRVGQTVFLLNETPLSGTDEGVEPLQDDDKELETLLETTAFHVTKTTAFRKMKTDKSGGSVGFLSFFEKESKS